MKITKRKTIRKGWIALLALVVLALGGGGFYWWQAQQTTAKAQAQKPEYNTTTARIGNITISATGSGELVASKEMSLAFSSSGTVSKVNVTVGSKVKAGDVLAELKDVESLKNSVLSAELDLRNAQKAVQTLKDNAAKTLAEAQLTLAEAQKAYDDAKAALVWKGLIRCDSETTQAYYEAYLRIQQQLDKYGKYDHTTGGYLDEIKPIEQKRDAAYATWKYCAGYTDYEIASSQATLAKKEAVLAAARTALAKLQENNGIDPDELATLENTVAKAQVALSKAQKNLDGTVIKAPFDGIILSVAGAAGDTVGTSTFITIADLENPQLDFYVDETDMDMVAVGYEVEVSFDAVPNVVFKGKVVRINPSLATVSGSKALQGLVQLILDQAQKNITLPKGLNATVEVIGGKAVNAVIVPVDALHKLDDGSYYVFLMVDGKPRMQAVEVGIMDLTSAEIKSGLKAGDVVTTGTTVTKTSKTETK